MSGTARMTGISNGPNSEDQPLIFHDANGKVSINSKAMKTAVKRTAKAKAGK